MPAKQREAKLLEALGGESGCRRLSTEFYARVARDPVLRPLFPGKSLRCATQEFAAFLIQFLKGDEGQTQHRWWLSLRESHARFQIRPAQRKAWLKQMGITLRAIPVDESLRLALEDFFLQTSAYVMGLPSSALEHPQLSARWSEQRILDETVAAIADGVDERVMSLAAPFAARPAVFVGLLARMAHTGRPVLVRYVLACLDAQPALGESRFAGRTLLHFASGAGCVDVVEALLRRRANPNVLDHGGHAPLYSLANECSSEAGPQIVRLLVQAGAEVNANGGVTGATALHLAARRGHVETARALLAYGARLDAKDRKGDTPLRRAEKCRQAGIAKLLAGIGSTPPHAATGGSK